MTMNPTDHPFISPNKPTRSIHAIDMHIDQQATMTPPPNFGSDTYHQSPFATWMNQLPSVPATELKSRTVSISRSHAFSSLAPLSKLSPTDECHAIDVDVQDADSRAHFATIKRTIPLQQLAIFGSHSEPHAQQPPSHNHSHTLCHHRHTSNGSGSDVSSASVNAGIELNAVAGPSSQPMLRDDSRGSSEDSQSWRRSRTLFGSSASHARLDEDVEMDVDSDQDDADEQPPASPSPLCEQPALLDPSASFNLDLGEPMLQPGTRPTHRLSRKSSSATTTHTLGSLPASASQRSRQPRSRLPSSSNISPPLSALDEHQLTTPARQRSTTSGNMEVDDTAEHAHALTSLSNAAATAPRALNRARASSSAALHRPLTEFLTPRSASASAGLGDKLAGVANLFEFATQPRPIIRPGDRDSDTTPLRDHRRKPANLSMSSFPTAKLFEDEIEAAAKSSNRAEPNTASAPHMASDSLTSTPARRTAAPLREFGSHVSSRYGETPLHATPHRLFGSFHVNTPADDSGVAFNDGEHSIKSNRKRMVSSLTSTAKESPMPAFALGHVLDDLSSPSQDALRRHETSFHRDSPAPRPSTRMVMHNFGPKERSSLMHETRFSNSSDNGSANSSPDPIPRTRSRTSTSISAASPARRARDRRPTSESVDATSQYLTPQNFRSVKPLQAAFMSTGLVSKRNRARDNSASADGGSDAFPLPPKPPNFGHALGLREVVAAASAHATAATDRPSNTMPDTPVKKATSTPLVPFPKFAPVLRSQMGANSSTSLGPSPLGVHSPATDPSSNVSTASPVLADSGDGDSPTLSLMNLGAPNASTPAAMSTRNGVAFGNLPRSRRSPNPDASHFQAFAAGDATEDEGNLSDVSQSPSVQSGRIRDVHRLQKGKRTITTPSSSGGHAPCRKLLSIDTAKAAGASKSLRVQSAGLGKRTISRNASFVHAKEGTEANNHEAQGDALPPSTPLITTSAEFEMNGKEDEMPPMTPTRNTTQIKWYQAAQVLTTPSPSSRRQAAQKLRAHRLELMKTRRKSRLSETSTCQDTPQKAAPGGVTSAAMASSDSSIDIRQRAQEHSHLDTAFTVEETIGSGEFSEVLKAVSKSTGYAYAVKRMKKAYHGPRDRLRRLEEVDVLRALSTPGNAHPNIVSLIGAWEEQGHLLLQLELCPLGSLAFFLEEYGQQVGALDEPRLWKIMAELSSGVAYIHAHNILHLDLKPANVLITEHGTLKIGDFGMATRWPKVDAETTLMGAGLEAEPSSGYALDQVADTWPRQGGLEREGDRVYLAPEVIFHGQYDKAADVFSLGLILLEAAGNVELPDNGEAWQKLRRDDFSDVDLSALSSPMLRVLSRLLCSDPEARATMDEVEAMRTMACVRGIMSRGLCASEMDQLPEFTESSSTSGSLVALADSSSVYSMASELSSRTLGTTDSETDSSNAGLSEADSGLSSSLSAQTWISTSMSSLASNGAVIRVRGALIQEPEEEFMREVLAADAMEQQQQQQQQQQRYEVTAMGTGKEMEAKRWQRPALAEVQQRVQAAPTTYSMELDG